MMLRTAFIPPADAVEELRALAGRVGVLPGVHPLPADRFDVRIAGMGNVSDLDARRLASRIETWVGVEVLPEVQWSGVQLQPNGDIGVVLSGDVSGLRDIVRGVGECAERVHVYVDRRAFQPLAVIATVDEQQPGSRVVSALERLTSWTGGSWTAVDVALIRIRWFAGQAVSEIVERVPIPVRRDVALGGQVVVEAVETR
ncbi:MAG: hypothetical protein NTX33_19690 [Propionibacteriales bacterium]|nr:hypothetical protein [Propionibacteriales bacterium]